MPEPTRCAAGTGGLTLFEWLAAPLGDGDWVACNQPIRQKAGGEPCQYPDCNFPDRHMVDGVRHPYEGHAYDPGWEHFDPRDMTDIDWESGTYHAPELDRGHRATPPVEEVEA